MVLEVALIDVTDAGRFRPPPSSDARQLLVRPTAVRSVRMTHGIEDPNRFVLLVEWDSVQAHEENFRATDTVQPVAGCDRTVLRPPAAGPALHRRLRLRPAGPRAGVR